MCLRTSLHFTPDGVSRTRAVITINMALLTEGERSKLPSLCGTEMADCYKSHA